MDIPKKTITSLPSTQSDYLVLTTDYVGNMIYENGVSKEILLPKGFYQGEVPFSSMFIPLQLVYRIILSETETFRIKIGTSVLEILVVCNFV